MVEHHDHGGSDDRIRRVGAPAAVHGVGEGELLAVDDREEACIEMGSELDSIVAHGGDPSLPCPLPVVQPKIIGTYRVGRTPRCATGQFTGASRVTVYWRRDGRKIRAASGSRYRLSAADRGHIATRKVDASSSAGHTTVASVSVVPR